MMIFCLIYIGLIFILNNLQVDCITCLNEAGEEVDWTVVHKLPKKGTYLYKSEGDTDDKYHFSNQDIFRDKIPPKNSLSVIGRILEPFFNNPDNYEHIFYNGFSNIGKVETLSPKDKIKRFGNGKGALIWNDEKAIFLHHSVPNFPNYSANLRRISSNELRFYPYLENEHAHSFLCINVKPEHIDRLIKLFIIIRAKVYYKNLGKSLKILSDAQKEIYGETNIKTENQDSSKHNEAPDTKSKPSTRKPKMIKANVKSNSIVELTTPKGKKFKIIANNSNNFNGIWSKITKNFNIQNQFIIKSYSAFLNPNRLTFASPYCNVLKFSINQSNVINGSKYKWRSRFDESNFGFTIKDPYLYCHSEISKGGLAVCLYDDDSVRRLNMAIQSTTENSCTK